MPAHDWSQVSAGIFHHFHNYWLSAIGHHLNAGILPPSYYALAEQFAGEVGPDVLTLERQDDLYEIRSGAPNTDHAGMLAVAEYPPKVSVTATSEQAHLIEKQKSLAIRHVSDDRIVALIEIVSSGNKSTQANLTKFLDKACAALRQGYHLLILDLQPRTSRDPEGIHGAIWSALGEADYHAPVDKPLTLAAYSAGVGVKCYVEPIAVGSTLCEMPLFLESGRYVNVPLELTYQQAWRDVPARWRREIDSTTGLPDR